MAMAREESCWGRWLCTHGGAARKGHRREHTATEEEAEVRRLEPAGGCIRTVVRHSGSGRHDNCSAGLGSPKRSRWLCPLLVRDRSSRRPRSRAVVRARARRRSERRARSWRCGCEHWPGRTAVAAPGWSRDRGKGFDFSCICIVSGDLDTYWVGFLC
ncbi:vegetative cell wall protein gp1-like [Iris pallida]|uniref:Vegetative cell wall protein gp1-like n=1 Tax=Iris pallida TaxID=29817 RepID=A0AAX6FF20_IRIPA|nr:vegetative cell wall protein gp1-like [Iris pallida]